MSAARGSLAAWLALLLLATAALLAGCTGVEPRIERLARSAHFTKDLATGTRFRHVVYRNAARRAGVLHVYIEGDGTPYLNGALPAADPTSRISLMLHLMQRDAAPSIYLGRPCYLGLAADPGCGPVWWTTRRFAPEVLASMAAVLAAEIDRAQATRVALFGHSGGGTLAVLLAERVPAVSQVVTIGPTLDVAAWCALHGYAPLSGSLTANTPPRAGLAVLHLVGAEDTNTPPDFVRAAARARGGERVEVVAGADHNCCWQPAWDALLARLATQRD